MLSSTATDARKRAKRKWAAANKDYHRKWQAAYRKKNRKLLNERRKLFYKEHAEKIKEARRKWRENNKNKARKQNLSSWYKTKYGSTGSIMKKLNDCIRKYQKNEKV